MSSKDVYLLAISPHPLDLEMGMGGTIVHFLREGKRIVYVVCTNHDKASSDPDMLPEELAIIRKKEQLEAAKVLGIEEVLYLHYPDLSLSYAPGLVKDILKLILEYRPEVVATCDPYQKYISNPDHRVTGRLVMDAVWPFAHAPNSYRDLLRQGYNLHKVKEVMLWQTAEPNYFVDITDTFETKMAALYCHKSQVGDPPEAGFIELATSSAEKAAEGQSYKMGESLHREEIPPRL